MGREAWWVGRGGMVGIPGCICLPVYQGVYASQYTMVGVPLRVYLWVYLWVYLRCTSQGDSFTLLVRR